MNIPVEGGRDDRGVPYHAESTLSSAQVLNIFVKRNNFTLLLHETFGGGFSPTAVLKLRRLARKAARGSVDRTAYSPKYSLSFMSHHAERISLSVVRGVNRAIRSHLATLSARLARA